MVAGDAVHALRRQARAAEDVAAALRATEIGAELLLKATKVDGIYDMMQPGALMRILRGEPLGTLVHGKD